MREHWENWGWVAVMPMFVIGFLRILYGREPFCGTGAEHCAREWISALGGWAAVAAAVPTIYYLSRQISSAERHHRSGLRLQLQKKYEHAEAVFKMEPLITRDIYLFKSKHEALDDAAYVAGYNRLRVGLHAILSSTAYDYFDAEFVFTATMNLTTTRNELLKIVPIDGRISLYRKEIDGLLNELLRQQNGMKTSAKSFMEQADQMIGSG